MQLLERNCKARGSDGIFPRANWLHCRRKAKNHNSIHFSTKSWKTILTSSWHETMHQLLLKESSQAKSKKNLCMMTGNTCSAEWIRTKLNGKKGKQKKSTNGCNRPWAVISFILRCDLHKMRRPHFRLRSRFVLPLEWQRSAVFFCQELSANQVERGAPTKTVVTV